MNCGNLLIERRAGVIEVTLNRPEKLNALGRGILEDLRATAERIAADASIRAVLLTGAGRAFCSGADLTPQGWPDERTQGPSDLVESRLRLHFNPMIRAWHELPVPVIVAVNGIAAGAGVSLALCGDLVVAARSAAFQLLFAPRLGLMPDLGATFFLPRLLGAARAKGLAMLGAPLRADDAVAWGLIWESVADGDLLVRARELAETLAAGPTLAYRRIKDAFDRGAPTLGEALEHEVAGQRELGASADFAEGLAAFRDKRAPRFRGT